MPRLTSRGFVAPEDAFKSTKNAPTPCGIADCRSEVAVQGHQSNRKRRKDPNFSANAHLREGFRATYENGCEWRGGCPRHATSGLRAAEHAGRRAYIVRCVCSCLLNGAPSRSTVPRNSAVPATFGFVTRRQRLPLCTTGRYSNS